MCVIEGGFVATGPGSRDGKIAIWRIEEETKEDLGFETIEFEIAKFTAASQPKYHSFSGNEKEKANNYNKNKYCTF